MYHVIDIQTKRTVRTFADDAGRDARAYAHRLDARHGAVRYVVRFIPQGV